MKTSIFQNFNEVIDTQPISKVLENIKNGSLVNGEEDSQGNGSLMRYAPAFILESCGKGENICRKINDLTHNSDFVRKQMMRLHDALEAALADDKGRIMVNPCLFISEKGDDPVHA